MRLFLALAAPCLFAPLPLEKRVVLEALDGSLALRSESELGPADLESAVLVRFEGFERPPDPGWLESDRAELLLLGGDRLIGQVIDGRGDVVDVQMIGGATVPVVVDRLRALSFPARVGADHRYGLLPAEQGDRLYWIRPGGLDRVDGTIEAFDGDGVVFDSVLGAKTFPWEEVAALFVEPFAEDAPASEDASATPVVLDLVDGSRLRGSVTELGAEGCTLALAGDGSVSFPLGALAELAVDDGTAAFLSDRAPAEVIEGSPFDDDIGMRWPHRVDRSVTGGPLVCDGRRYMRGIGVHAPSRMTWALDGAWRGLRGSVGIDDSVLLLPHQGSVHFRISVDGEEVWDSGLVRGGRAPLAIPEVDLEGAVELVLEVDMATRFHVADRANWLRVLLVR